MEIVELSRENFDDVVITGSLVFVDFGAQWCGPCRVFEKVYHKVAEKFPNFTFAKVDIEQNPELADDFNIRSIPMLMIFREGIAIYAETGALTQSAFEDIVRRAERIDVSELKKSIQDSQERK